MSQSPFARAFITSAFIAGAVFTASTLPLAMAKSKVVDIELQNQTIFSSEVKDLAAPYLSLSGAFSVALGFGVFGLMGWQNSARRLSQVKQQSDNLARNLAVHQTELERIKFSESRLQAQNVTSFLPARSLSEGIPSSVQPSEPAFARAATHSDHGMRTEEPAGFRYTPSLKDYQTAPDVSAQPLQQMQILHPEPAPQGEVLTSLVQQLNHLSRQVEELRNSDTNGLAA